jgi:hypothetical protein
MEKHPNIQAILAHIQSAWNYQKWIIVNGSRGSFPTNQWVCCSRLLATAHVCEGKSRSHGRSFTTT